ncbi:MAG: MarR family winged helix-turn-helix transcriptional regulator [Alphaproteobacteria bacterium]
MVGQVDKVAIVETKSPADQAYGLDAQVGFLLRRVMQRHLVIFSGLLPDVTATQFATMAKSYELGPVSQNELGRATAMDAATVKGVIDRLQGRGLMATAPNASDRRRLMVSLTEQGRLAFEAMTEAALRITDETLAPLSQAERRAFLRSLKKLS